MGGWLHQKGIFRYNKTIHEKGTLVKVGNKASTEESWIFFYYICNQYVQYCQVEETKKYNIYFIKYKVKKYLIENRTLSCVKRIDGSFVFILRKKQQIYLNIENSQGKDNQLFNYEIQMDAHVILNECDIVSVKNHYLLLPILNSNVLPTKSDVLKLSSIYTIISVD